MRVLLIDPPQHVFTGIAPRLFSPGLASVGASLRAAGHDVAILETDRLSRSQSVDFANEYEMLAMHLEALNDPSHWVWDSLARLLADYKPALVGVMAVTMRFGSVVRVAELCKRVLPTAPVIAGGPHVTDWPEMA
ncbi:MAG: cobalamin-dependent protein, partial [Armatimonadota bacterium]